MKVRSLKAESRAHNEPNPSLADTSIDDVTLGLQKPFREIYEGDARRLLALPDNCVDLVVTSPAYWRKRDYGFADQIGQEKTPGEYVNNIIAAMTEWRRVLRPSGSIFLNIGDTYWRRSLQGIPSLVEAFARNAGWVLRNRIIWIKRGGMPDPVQTRLTGRHEYILHFAINGYYYDLFGYAEHYSLGKKGANPGDVWEIAPQRNLGKHLSPFPSEIVERAITLACPQSVCSRCGEPRRRIVERTTELDTSRPQARRALEIAREGKLTPQHIAAIQATGISDAGKAGSFKTVLTEMRKTFESSLWKPKRSWVAISASSRLPNENHAAGRTVDAEPLFYQESSLTPLWAPGQLWTLRSEWVAPPLGSISTCLRLRKRCDGTSDSQAYRRSVPGSPP